MSTCIPFSGKFSAGNSEGVFVNCNDANSVLGWPKYDNVHYMFNEHKVAQKLNKFKVRSLFEYQ